VNATTASGNSGQPNAPRSNLPDAGWAAVSLLFWVAATAVARQVLDRDLSGVLARAGAVAVASGAFILVVVMLVRFVRTLDEFSRRVQLVAAAAAFVVTITVVVAADLLQAAHFLGYVPLDEVWVFMLVAWCVSMFAVAWYYR